MNFSTFYEFFYHLVFCFDSSYSGVIFTLIMSN